MKILIIKFGALGDIVMATPLITAIVNAHPRDEIHLLTTAPYEPIFSPWPGLQVAAHPRRGITNMVRTIAWIRGLRCARIYDLQGSDRSSVLCAFSGSPMRIGNHTRYPYTHHPSDRWTGQCHIFERLTDVLAAVGINSVPAIPTIPVGAAELDLVTEWLAAESLPKQSFVLLHAAASLARPEKRWPFFESLGRRLNGAGLKPVWIGAGNDTEVNRRLSVATCGIDATDKFNIAALVELGRHARFAVTNDSGPMHVLSAAGIPVFGLFGPSDWRRNHALGQRSNVIAGVEMIDTYRGANTADCLAEISADMVWQKLESAGVL